LLVTGSFRIDASVAIVGLFLSEGLIGLIVGLWAYLAKFQGLVPILPIDLDYGSPLFLFAYCSCVFVFASVKGPKTCGACLFSRTSSSNVRLPAALDQICVIVPPVFSSIRLCLTGSTV